MAAIAVSADGENIFLAMENDSGQPVIAKCSRDDLETFTAAYNPAAGTAANVASVPGNADLMLFYGNFGSGVQVIKHTISTATNTNISPSSLTTKVVNALAVDPSDADRIKITVDTNQDLLGTEDGGDNWTTLNAALGFNATALMVKWQGDFEYDIDYVAGDNGANLDLLFSPNDGADFDDIAGATLGGAAAIVGVEGDAYEPAT